MNPRRERLIESARKYDEVVHAFEGVITALSSALSESELATLRAALNALRRPDVTSASRKRLIDVIAQAGDYETGKVWRLTEEALGVAADAVLAEYRTPDVEELELEPEHEPEPEPEPGQTDDESEVPNGVD